MEKLSGLARNVIDALAGPDESVAAAVTLIGAPLLVAFLVGRLTSRWQSRLSWLTAEYERRAAYYGQMSEAAHQLSAVLGVIVENVKRREDAGRPPRDASPLGSFGESRGGLEPGPDSEQISLAVDAWRAQSVKVGMLASGYGMDFIRAADGHLDGLLRSLAFGEDSGKVATHAELMHTSLQCTLSALNRDMLRLRGDTIRALPWRQRWSERRALRRELENVDRTIEEAGVIVSRLTRQLEGNGLPDGDVE